MSIIPLLPNPYAHSDIPPTKTELRVLTSEETQQLKPVFEQAGADLPDPSTSFIIGILEDEKITESFLTVQFVLHGEPMHIAPRHLQYIKSMVHFAENEVISRVGVRNVFIFVPENQTKKLAELLGWTEQPWKVLSKIVGPAGDPS